MIVGHSYQTAFPFTLYKNTENSESDGRIFPQSSFLVVDRSDTPYRYSLDRTYRRYKVLQGEKMGWILVMISCDDDLDSKGECLMMPHCSGPRESVRDITLDDFDNLGAGI